MRAGFAEAGAPAVAAGRAAARAGFLLDGETVLLSIRPSLWFIPLGTIAPVGLVVFLVLIARQAVLITQAPLDPGNIIRPATVLIALRVAWQALDWGSRRYVLTDRRIVRTHGVIRRATFEAPLRHVTHLDLRKSALERMAGVGTIGINTAGTAFTEAWWIDVPRPEAVMRVIREALERYGR